MVITRAILYDFMMRKVKNKICLKAHVTSHSIAFSVSGKWRIEKVQLFCYKNKLKIM